MSERISRRDLFKDVLPGLLAGVVGYTAVNIESGLKTWQITDLPTKRILEYDPALLATLDTRAKEIEEGFKFDGSIQSITKNRLSPRPETFARAMIRMAYLEGGEEEVQQVINTINSTEIIIGTTDLPTYILGVASARFDDDKNPSRITQLSLKTDTGSVSDEEIYFHELYHLVQYARNPKLAKELTFPKYVIDSPIYLAGIGAVWGSVRGISVSRRKFLSGGICGATAIAANRGISKLQKLLSPDDLPHAQLNQNLELFFLHPYLATLKGQLFDNIPK